MPTRKTTSNIPQIKLSREAKQEAPLQTMFDIFRAIQQLFVEIEVERGPNGIKADCVAGDVEDC